MARKITVRALEGFGENYIKTLLINFDRRYQRRILRYYYRSIRNLRRRLR